MFKIYIDGYSWFKVLIVYILILKLGVIVFIKYGKFLVKFKLNINYLIKFNYFILNNIVDEFFF